VTTRACARCRRPKLVKPGIISSSIVKALTSFGTRKRADHDGRRVSWGTRIALGHHRAHHPPTMANSRSAATGSTLVDAVRIKRRPTPQTV